MKHNLTVNQLSRKAATATTGSVRVLITMATCGRPEQLDRALNTLTAITVPHHAAVELLIIDNAGDAGERVDLAARKAPWPVHYLDEPVRGLVRVRNAALDFARRTGVNFIAFVDDDEQVDPAWITELLAAASASGADAVIGKVCWDCPEEPPWWLSHAFLLDFRGAPNLSPVNFGYTGNALVALDRTATDELSFSNKFNFSGGEDTRFFHDMLEAGGQIVYAASAVTHERIELERLHLSWWFQRWFRTGITTGNIKVDSGRSTRLDIMLYGILRIAVGSIGLLATAPVLLASRPGPLRFVRMICRGSGCVAYVFGIRYEEYQIARKTQINKGRA